MEDNTSKAPKPTMTRDVKISEDAMEKVLAFSDLSLNRDYVKQVDDRKRIREHFYQTKMNADLDKFSRDKGINRNKFDNHVKSIESSLDKLIGTKTEHKTNEITPDLQKASSCHQVQSSVVCQFQEQCFADFDKFINKLNNNN